jgi:hypothetical protein
MLLMVFNLFQVNRWTHSARAVRSQAETVGYIVTSFKVTSHCPGSVKFSRDDDISSHENRNKKRKDPGGGGHGQSIDYGGGSSR